MTDVRPTLTLRRFITPSPYNVDSEDPTHRQDKCPGRGAGHADHAWETVQPERVAYPHALYGERPKGGGIIDYGRSVTGNLPGFTEEETCVLLWPFLIMGGLEGDPTAMRLLLRIADVDNETLALLTNPDRL